MAKRKWTQETAVSYLSATGAEVRGKVITFSKGLKGLTSCSAVDYLVGHCGYIG